MPGRDGSGPTGKGSRTGRGMGNCNPASVNIAQTGKDSTIQPIFGGGRGWFGVFGRWFGRGRQYRKIWK